VFDINLRQGFWSRDIIEESLNLADVLKLNDEELVIVADLFELAGSQEAQIRRLARRFDLKAVALTRGANGAALVMQDEFLSQPGRRLQVVDTVGAGDSFAAVFALGLVAGVPADRILRCATNIAEFVCTQPGAMPPLPLILREQVASELSLKLR
jgi:fructokinase